MKNSLKCRDLDQWNSVHFVDLGESFPILVKFGFDTGDSEPCKVCPLSAYQRPAAAGSRADERPERAGGHLRSRGLCSARFCEQVQTPLKAKSCRNVGKLDFFFFAWPSARTGATQGSAQAAKQRTAPRLPSMTSEGATKKGTERWMIYSVP